MTLIELTEPQEFRSTCPGCGTEIPNNQPLPSCNECDCCFCSEECRHDYHHPTALCDDEGCEMAHIEHVCVKLHNYSKPLDGGYE